MSYYTDPLVTLLHGDCIEVMATLPADSVDSVVTDPPYGLEFMGKEWDALGDVGKVSHAGPRDRDASTVFGRQRVAYNGSANSRCRNCGKWKWGHTTGDGGGGGKKCECDAPDFPSVQGHQARLMQKWHYAWALAALRVTKPGGYLLAFGGTRTHHRLVCALEDAGWIIRDELDWIYASGFPKGKANLKPAHEPIVLARKPGPLRPLAIDECRITYQPGGRPSDLTWSKKARQGTKAGAAVYGQYADTNKTIEEREHPDGRWPSNVLLSDPELFDEPNPYVVGSGTTVASGIAVTRNGGGGILFGTPLGSEVLPDSGYGDSGGYSRFFIVPKADRAERERGLAPGEKVWSDGREKAADYPSQRGATARANVHPTVKPIDLMRHLVRLVTPSGGVVLDPFLGSGTTCLAASEEGFRSIGIEREMEYLEIAKGRLMATPMGLGLDVPAPEQRPAKAAPYTGERHGGGHDWHELEWTKGDPEEVA